MPSLLFRGLGSSTGVEPPVLSPLRTVEYIGNGASQDIVSNIDLSGSGGLVWIKNLDSAVKYAISDSLMSLPATLDSSSSDSESSFPQRILSLNNDGFSIGSEIRVNTNNDRYVSWSFEKKAGFLDLVRYGGNNVAGRAITHSLGVSAGLCLVKCTTTARFWAVQHRSQGYENSAYLNDSGAFTADNTFRSPTMDSSTITIGNSPLVNASGDTYAMMIFAHDTTPTGVVQCDQYTGNGVAGLSVNLGWRPKYVMIKAASTTGDWYVFDTTRGIGNGGSDAELSLNDIGAEVNNTDFISLTTTGFQIVGASINVDTENYIYMAIRE